MSNIGKQPINIPKDVSVEINKGIVNVKGTLGDLHMSYNTKIKITSKDNIINVIRNSNHREERSLHGLYRALINNMIVGVSLGFKKELNFVGVGYGVEIKGDCLLINAGYSHPIYLQVPESIEVDTPNNTTLVIKGANKQNVGDMAAKIRAIRKPEPYKGKGIKYRNEYIKRKAGKTVGATGA